MSHEYIGTAYRQALDAKAPWLVSFVATAEDVSTWAGIPRRTEKGLIGFQRPDDDNRVARAAEYFKDPQNQSPTALILGVHRVNDESQRRVILEFLDDDVTKAVRRCKLKVDFDPNEMTLEKSIEDIKKHIQLRLMESSAESGEELDDTDDTDDDIDIESVEDEDSEGEDNQEIELGRSLLQDLMKKLDEKEWCDNNKEALLDLSKPATVIDGQHRLKGAKKCEREIPFSIIAIFDCSWPEQVFQFTVVNYTAKGIPDQFITANAALSLTGGELDQLKARLTQAKVKVTEYELMRVVNFDAESPFFQKVSMASSGSEANKIGYKTMVKIAKNWHSGKNAAVKQIIANLYPEIKGKASAVKRDRYHRWMEEDWGSFFVAFWRPIFEYYASKGDSKFDPWSIGQSNLTIAAVLLEYQNAFLINLAQQDEEFFEVDSSHSDNRPAKAQLIEKIRKRAEKVAGFIPIDFFKSEWKMKSLNTGVGRAAIQTALKSFVENKGSYQYDKSSLITGKTS
jgi:hypothetical protein